MRRTAEQLADDRAVLLAALEETTVPEGYPGLTIHQVLRASTGRAYAGQSAQRYAETDLRHLARAGKVTITYRYSLAWYRLRTEQDQDVEDDANEVHRLMQGWEPADVDR